MAGGPDARAGRALLAALPEPSGLGLRLQSLTQERKENENSGQPAAEFVVSEVGDCVPLCVKAQLAASGFGSPARRCRAVPPKNLQAGSSS